MWLGKTQVHSPAAYGGLCLLRHGYLPAAFRIGHPLLFPLPPALLVPRQSIPHSLILQLGTPSATSHKCVDTGIPFSPTIRLPAARSSGTLPLAGATPPDAPADLPFAGSALLRIPPKNLSSYKQCHTIREYMALY